jgi:CheY-like chemotaxis protein
MNKKLVYIIDDNDADILLVKESLRNFNSPLNMVVFQDGENAIEQFKTLDANKELSLPELIILDINIPRQSGMEVLKFIRSREQLHHMPVVMMSTSRSNKDVLKSYQLGANSYVSKPIDFNDFFDSINEIFNYWFNRSLLPIVDRSL